MTEPPTHDALDPFGVWREAVLVDLRERLRTAVNARTLHETGSVENGEWLRRALVLKREKEHERQAVIPKVQMAQAAIDKNANWVAQVEQAIRTHEAQLDAALKAGRADEVRTVRDYLAQERTSVAQAQSALDLARRWSDEATKPLEGVERELAKQEENQRAAQARYWMHDYLRFETTSSAANLRALIDKMSGNVDKMSGNASAPLPGPRIRTSTVNGRDITACTLNAPCVAQMLGDHLLTLQLESRGYACIIVQDRFGNRYPQPPGIVDGTDVVNPIAFGGRGVFTLTVRSSGAPRDCNESASPADSRSVDQRVAYFDVR
jgi:hypothetical protein